MTIKGERTREQMRMMMKANGRTPDEAYIDHLCEEHKRGTLTRMPGCWLDRLPEETLEQKAFAMGARHARAILRAVLLDGRTRTGGR